MKQNSIWHLLTFAFKTLCTYTFRSRDDTVRQIVCNLTDDGSNELLDELQKGQPLLDDGCSSDDELDDWENWMPDPVDADPSKSLKQAWSGKCLRLIILIHYIKQLCALNFKNDQE